MINWQAFVTWWNQPINAKADASSWIIFTGFIMIVIWLWTRVLKEGGHVITEAV